MEGEINAKFRNSYKDEYDALFEAVFGESNTDDQQFGADDSSCEDGSIGPAATPSFGDDRADDTTWSYLPDLLLERIYTYLTIQERYHASLVCRSWYEAFHLPNVWRTFVFDDKTLTRRLFNYYSGWQYMLDHLRAQLCLNSVGRHIKTLIFKPISNFYNLYEFMNMISFYTEQQEHPGCSVKGIGSQIISLQYTFPCNMAVRNETRLYGTGGKLLAAVKRLMGNLPSLRDLQLVDLMLDSQEALQLLDEVCYSHCLAMKTLVLVNISKIQCPLLHVGVFLNLEELTISPQSLGDDVLDLLAQTQLRHLHIMQNSYTPTDVKPCTWQAWKMCRQSNWRLRVHLHVESATDRSLIWQEGAPVHTILFDSPRIVANAEVIAQAINKYSNTLRVFGYMSLPRYYQPKSFHERIDCHLLFLCNNCPNLQTLIVRERISTATILQISHSATNLRCFYVRRNAVILRSDWPRNPEWSDDHFEWMRTTSRSYESTEAAVSSILGYKWNMLSDKEFKLIKSKVQLHPYI